MSIRRLMAGAFSALLISLGAGQLDSLQAQEASDTRSADQQFINGLAAENLLEVRLGEAAVKSASSPSVKQFGQQMVTDHTAMQKAWMDLASENDLDFRARWTMQQSQRAASLRGMTGAAFDRAYMGMVVQSHAAKVDTFQNELRVTHSAEVRNLIARDLATLQNHLRQAQLIGRQVGVDVSGGVATTTPSPDTTGVITQNRPRTDTTGVITQNRPQADTTVITQNRPQADTGVITQNRRQADTTVITQNRPQDRNRRPGQAEQRDERAGRGDAVPDDEFIRDVNADHLLEVRLGQLAQEKGRDEDVKRFGQRMERDHGTLHKQWTELRSRQGMSPQAGMGPNHRAKLERMQKATGRAFDRQYMTLMIQNHHGYLNYWRTQGRTAEAASIRQLVKRGFPMLEEHMDMARRVGRQVGVDAQTALASPRIFKDRRDRPTVIR